MQSPKITDLVLLEANDVRELTSRILDKSRDGWHLSGNIAVQKDIRQYGSVYKTYYWATMIKLAGGED